MTEEIKIGLPESADITMVATFQETLKEALDQGSPVELDASAVTRADTAFLQLLTSFLIEASANQLPVNWGVISDSFKQAVNLLGLSNQLKIS